MTWAPNYWIVANGSTDLPDLGSYPEEVKQARRTPATLQHLLAASESDRIDRFLESKYHESILSQKQIALFLEL